MTAYRRYCIYVVPEGPLYDRGADWLGWDSVAGRDRTPPELPGLSAPAATLTRRPRKYGFHGTVKPPFRLAAGADPEVLRAALDRFCAGRAPVALDGLAVAPMGRFVALRPEGPTDALAALAGDTVRALDAFRDPPTEAEIASRTGPGLTERQASMLARWGYPFVMDEFRFHLTLTGPLEAPTDAARILTAHFDDVLSRPMVICSLALLGEAADGRFHVLHRSALSG